MRINNRFHTNLSVMLECRRLEGNSVQVLKLRENGPKNSQRCWANNARRCSVRLHLAKGFSGFKLCATTSGSY